MERARPRGVRIAPIAPTRVLRGQGALSDGWIEIPGDVIEEYEFRPDPDFLPAVAAIDTPERALRFVARYGLLFAAPELEDEDVPEWMRAGQLVRFNESVDEYLALASQLRELRRIYALSQRVAYGDRFWIPALRNAIQRFGSEDQEADVSEPTDTVMRSLRTEALLFLSSTLVAVTVTEALDSYGASFLVGVDEPVPAFALFPASPTLAGHAWLQVAAEVVQQVELESCEACGVLFVVKDPRQRYCTPRCANRDRSRRFRAKHS
jgi:hypothetical protein